MATDANETGQTGQEKNLPYIEVRKDEEGWNWLLRSGNGRFMATNVTSYKTRTDCTDAIDAFVASLGGTTPRIVITRTT